MNNWKWLFATFYLVSLSCFPQITQPDRIEILLSDQETPFEVLQQDETSLLLYRQNNILNGNNEEWQFIGLDSNLNIQWNNKIYIQSSLDLLKNTSFNSKSYFLFNNPADRLNLLLVSIDDKGNVLSSIIANTIPFELTHFEATDKGVLIGGLYNYRPLVIYYVFETNKSIILPGFYHERSELIQLTTNKDGNIEIIISAQSFRIRNKLILFVKTFDVDGNMIKDIMLEDKNDRENLLFGKSCYESDGVQIVAGTYSSRRTQYSRGLFLSTIDYDGKYKVRYYNYGEMHNFFKYMTARRENRVKKRIERRKIKNKKLRFNYRLIVHEILNSNQQYILLGEAFYPKYTQATNAQIAGFGPTINRTPERTFDGYVYTHAVLAAFDKSGNLLWDNSFEINDVQTFDLERYVYVSVEDDKLILFYVFDNQIRYKTIKNSEVIEGEKYTMISLNYINDELIDQSINEIKPWHDNYFYIYGVQQIRNLKDDDVELTRKVFYINKIASE